MVAVVLALGLSIGYVTDLAYGYVSNDIGRAVPGVDEDDILGTGATNAVKTWWVYCVWCGLCINSYSSLSCGSLDYPIINRIPLLGFYHQESYTGRPTATHMSIPDTREYQMLGSQSIVGTTGTIAENSKLAGDVSIAYFQNSYIASLLTGFTGDIIKDSKAMMR